MKRVATIRAWTVLLVAGLCIPSLACQSLLNRTGKTRDVENTQSNTDASSSAQAGSGSVEQSTLIQKGDEIRIYRRDLNSVDRVIEEIEWQQDMAPRQDRYVQAAAAFGPARRKAIVIVFVQQVMVESLLAKCKNSSGDYCEIVVDDDFQYGQDAAGTLRFLVYHERSNKPYQHRFINTTTSGKVASSAQRFTEVAGSAVRVLPGMIGAAAGMFADVADVPRSLLGDSLRDF